MNEDPWARWPDDMAKKKAAWTASEPLRQARRQSEIDDELRGWTFRNGVVTGIVFSMLLVIAYIFLVALFTS